MFPRIAVIDIRSELIPSLFVSTKNGLTPLRTPPFFNEKVPWAVLGRQVQSTGCLWRRHPLTTAVPTAPRRFPLSAALGAIVLLHVRRILGPSPTAQACR